MFKRSFQKWIVLVAIVCVVANLLPGYAWVSIALADTDGPGMPNGGPRPGNNDAKGPCTDPGTATSSGIGNGYCGRCGNLTWTYTGGSCAGTSQAEANDCNDCNTPTTFVQNFVSTPVGSLTYAACFAAGVACMTVSGILDIIGGSVCAGVCVGSWWTWGASCWACITGEAALVSTGAAVCACTYEECIEDCDYTTTDTFGSTAACS